MSDSTPPQCAWVTRAGVRCAAPVRSSDASQTLCSDHRYRERARVRDLADRPPPATRVLALDLPRCQWCPRAATHGAWCFKHHQFVQRQQSQRQSKR